MARRESQCTQRKPLQLEHACAPIIVSDSSVHLTAFVRDALRLALRQLRIAELERQHAEGYAQHPVEPGEFDVWFRAGLE